MPSCLTRWSSNCKRAGTAGIVDEALGDRRDRRQIDDGRRELGVDLTQPHPDAARAAMAGHDPSAQKGMSLDFNDL